jgi:PleD family two-component response regulator
MTLTVPPTTLAILEEIEAARQPTVDCEVADKLSGLHQANGLTDFLMHSWASALRRAFAT